VNADVVIHYGNACLSRTLRLPVFYVFGRAPLDIDEFSRQFCSYFTDQNLKLIIFTDLTYNHEISRLMDIISSQGYRNISYARVQSHFHHTFGFCEKDLGKSAFSHDCRISAFQMDDNFKSVSEHCETYYFGGRYFSITKDEGELSSLPYYSFLYIGTEGRTLNNLMMTFNRSKFHSYDPFRRLMRLETMQVNRALMRRYYLVQQAKDVELIGIIVGTLGVANYLKMIDYLKSIIIDAGKRYHIFVIGKLNVVKLANFQEIDLFVLVSCPENSCIDSKEFYKPIITPFELQVALVRGKEWNGDYEVDFSRLFPCLLREDESQSKADVQIVDDEEEFRFSLISGSLKKNPKYIPQANTNINTEHQQFSQEFNSFDDAGKDSSEEHESSNNTNSKYKKLNWSISNGNRNGNMELSNMSHSHTENFFRSRTFVGLEPKYGETAVGNVVEGRTGLPKGYEGEGLLYKESDLF